MTFAAVVKASRRDLLLVLASVAAGGYFAIRDDAFLSLGNVTNIAQQNAVLFIIAVGMTPVIIVRGIDLSVGASLALASVTGGLFAGSGGNSGLVIAMMLLTATLVGLANGLLVAFAGIAPFMATLGTLGVCTGAALALSHSSSISITSPVTNYLGLGQVGTVPVAAIVAILVALVIGVLLAAFRWGRNVYATGGNPEAARLALVPKDAVIVSCYIVQGMCVGLAAVLATGRLGSAQPVVDSTLAFSVISAVVIGGTRLTGGEGNIFGTALGVILLGLVNVGLAFSSVSPETVNIILGLIVVIAVASTELNFSRLVPRTRSEGAEDELNRGTTMAVRDISKRFGSVTALEKVSFDLHVGEIVALVGENGAGKTTLVNVMSEVLAPDEGRVTIRRSDTRADRNSPVALVHQHLAILPDLKVWENLFLGTGVLSPWKVFRSTRLRRKAQENLDRLGIPIRADDPVRRLTLGERQMLEIARAFIGKPSVVVLDEATSAISEEERDVLHRLVRAAASSGATVVYISHRMRDIYDVAGRVIVLRDGRLVADCAIAEVPEDELVRLTVGRPVDRVFPHTPRTVTDDSVVLHTQGLSDGGRLHAATLTVRQGEVVGVAGLLGSGRSELLRCIAGYSLTAQGQVEILGRDCGHLSARRRAGLGVAFVPEDRQADGLFGDQSVRFNVSLPWLGQLSTCGAVSRRRESVKVAGALTGSGVRPNEPSLPVGQLSGGNQQKVLLARWLEMSPMLLLLDEPTRGVDVGAKAELHSLIGEAKNRGAAILMVSSELPEVIGVSDRIIVMSEGSTVGELARGCTEEDIAQMWFNHESTTAAVAVPSV